MKVTKDKYCRWCHRVRWWTEKLGLRGWRISFEHADLEDGTFAICTRNSSNKCAMFRLCRSVSKEDEPEFDPERLAIHEALHLNCADFAKLCRDRHCTLDQIEMEEEAMIRRLESLILELIGDPS